MIESTAHNQFCAYRHSTSHGVNMKMYINFAWKCLAYGWAGSIRQIWLNLTWLLRVRPSRRDTPCTSRLRVSVEMSLASKKKNKSQEIVSRQPSCARIDTSTERQQEYIPSVSYEPRIDPTLVIHNPRHSSLRTCVRIR